MRQRNLPAESPFCVQIHPKHFSTRRTVQVPTIDMVKPESGVDRVRLMFPRAMEVIEGSFKIRHALPDRPLGIGPPVAVEPTLHVAFKVRVADKVFKITLESD